MPNYSTNLKTWGSTGSEFPDNYNYVEGEQPVDAWDNFFNSNVINDIDHLINVTNTELLARDGSVDLQADLSDDNANTIWDYSAGYVPVGSIEQGSGSGLNADTLDGFEAAELGVDLEEDGAVIVSNGVGINFTDFINVSDDGDDTVTVKHDDTSTQSNVSAASGAAVTDINVDDAGHVTSIGTTDLDARYYTETESDNRFLNSTSDTFSGYLDGRAGDRIGVPTYTSESDLPAGNEGDIAYVKDTDEVYVYTA